MCKMMLATHLNTKTTSNLNPKPKFFHIYWQYSPTNTLSHTHTLSLTLSFSLSLSLSLTHTHTHTHTHTQSVVHNTYPQSGKSRRRRPHLVSSSRTRAEVSRTPGTKSVKSDFEGAQKIKNNRETGRGGSWEGASADSSDTWWGDEESWDFSCRCSILFPRYPPHRLNIPS